MEEFAVARLLLRGAKRESTAAGINEDFDGFDLNKNRKITKEEFYDEHIRMLNAIPRPIEEKVEIISTKKSKLEKAAKAAAFAGRKQKGMDVQEFLDLLNSEFGSLKDAHIAMDSDCSGSVDIVQLVDALDILL